MADYASQVTICVRDVSQSLVNKKKIKAIKSLNNITSIYAQRYIAAGKK